MKAPVHVAFVGGSGSGKTWLAEKITATLAPRAARISLDDFYRDLSTLTAAERNRVNFDDPAAIDWDLLRGTMESITAARAVELPVYDFATHTRMAETRPFATVSLVVWDGLWLLHHDWLREKFDFSVFVDCDVSERFRRRSERDVRERGRTHESVRCQFYDHVQPLHDQFVEPQRRRAAIILASPFNEAEFTVLVHELLTKSALRLSSPSAK